MPSTPPTPPAVQQNETPLSPSPQAPQPTTTTTNPQTPSSQTSNPQPPTHKPSLSTLSPELRSRIWNYTFTPRTIKLRFHTGKTPSMTAQAHQPWITDQPLKTACIVITATEDPTPTKTPDQPWKRGDYRNWTFTEPMKRPVARGPVALYVCAESRALAKKRYQLAFAGTNCVPEQAEFTKVWHETGYGEKRVWVDFERDVIFLEMDWKMEFLRAGPAATVAWPSIMEAMGADATPMPRPPQQHQPLIGVMATQYATVNHLIQSKALETLAMYTKAETRKIKRFVMGGNWQFRQFRQFAQYNQLNLAQLVGNNAWNGNGNGSGNRSTQTPLDLRHFKDFENLEELFICDAFQDPLRRSLLGSYNDGGAGNVDPQTIIEEVVTSWELSKEKLTGGRMEMKKPSIRVVRCLGQIKGCPGCGVTHPGSEYEVSHRFKEG